VQSSVKAGLGRDLLLAATTFAVAVVFAAVNAVVDGGCDATKECALS
jgi:hypothetical protein